MITPDTTPAAEAADAPSEGRRSRRRRELHQSILATAAELFARDGYDVTTIEKIAAASDIAQATFFNHFRSKEDVLREVGRDVFTRFRRLVEEQLARPATTRERLAGFARRSAELVRRAPEMTRRVLIAVLRSSRPGQSGDELATMQAAFVELLASGRSAKNGDVRDDVELDIAAELLVSVVIGAMTHWINNPDYPLESRLGQTLSLVADRLLLATAEAPATRTAAPGTVRTKKSPTTSTTAAAGRSTPTKPAAQARSRQDKPGAQARSRQDRKTTR